MIEAKIKSVVIRKLKEAKYYHEWKQKPRTDYDWLSMYEILKDEFTCIIKNEED